MSLLATIGGFLGSQGFSNAMNTLGGTASGIAGIIQGKKNRKAAKEIAQMQYDSTIEGINLQNEANRELAEYQNQWNLAQWNRERFRSQWIRSIEIHFIRLSLSLPRFILFTN